MNQPLLIFVEGANDLDFLMRLTERLRVDLPHLPDLCRWQSEGRVLLVPAGGGDPASWPDRLRSLGCREFHLYDREQQPETNVRRRAIDRINARHGCFGALTTKRALENYLHPQAIAAAGGGPLSFGDHDPVCMRLAHQWYEQTPASLPWDNLTRRTQRRLANRAKRWLNTKAVQQMTAELLAVRDPAAELLAWLQIIGQMAPGTD